MNFNQNRCPTVYILIRSKYYNLNNKTLVELKGLVRQVKMAKKSSISKCVIEGNAKGVFSMYK